MIDFGVKDAIDILSVALILFYIYRLMKESSAANIFSGIIIVVIMWLLVTQVFEMRLLGTILNAVVNMGGLALIILFHEEIRRFLSSIGAHHKTHVLLRLLGIKKRGETQREDIIPIVMACMSMSKQKVGALIVLEQDVGLNEYIRSGDIINANINQRLIENIFFKNSPLHDGAMIIGHKRIKAAGCILPVAHNPDIPKALGLRHRAALGISQKTDCMAIIVSEETGGISLAQNGQFHLRMTAEELEHKLAENWG